MNNCDESYILIKNDKVKNLIKILYFMISSKNSCEQIKKFWFLIYSIIVIFILFTIIYVVAILFNCFFGLKNIKTYPPTHKDVVNLLLEKYMPSKADNYFNKAKMKEIDLEEPNNEEKVIPVEKPVEEKELVEEPSEETIFIEEKDSNQNMPKRFDLENFLINSNEKMNCINNEPPLRLTNFPIVEDELELYTKLLLAQLTSRNRSVETSTFYKMFGNCEGIFKPIYKKSLELALDALNHLK